MEDKPIKGTALGVILTLFTGLIGFILCLVLGDEDCRKASIKTFIIAIIIEIVLVIILVSVYTASVASLYRYYLFLLI